MERLLTIDEIAEILSLSSGKIRVMIRKNGLPFVKIAGSLRFRVSEVNAWVEQWRTDGKDIKG